MKDSTSTANASTSPAASYAPRVLAVVVTYNRPERLAECIRGLREQTRPPDEILVVDHSSDPAAQSAIDALKGVVVIRQANSGGAGGFHRGMTFAWQAKFDWAWLMDDDVVPTSTALHALLCSPYAALPDTGFLSSRVVDSNGKTYMTGTPSHWWESADTIALDLCYRVGGGTFVGFLVNRRAIEKCGLPLREYFIYDDDIEYSERVARSFRAYCVITSVVTHNQPKPKADSGKPAADWKHLHLSRNRASRIITSDAPLLKKGFRLARHAVKMMSAVRLASVGTLKVPFWLLWGTFFFRPSITFPKDLEPAGQPEAQRQ